MRFYWLLITLIMFNVILFLGDLALGSVDIPLSYFWGSNPAEAQPQWEAIVWQLRLPRAITAVLAGAALAVSGLLMQTIFRNPMAGPYVLGVSAGASLGVALLMLGSPFVAGLLHAAWAGQLSTMLAAWAGTLAVLMLILAVSLRIRSAVTILIIGMMFGSGVSALVNLLQYFGSEAAVKSYVVWTMGSLGKLALHELPLVAFIVAGGLFVALFLSKPLNLMLLGEHYASTLGVPVLGVRMGVFVLTSLLTGTITAFCGPISFIGIAVPHIARLVFRESRHQRLTPAVILTGSAIMLISDMASKLPGSANSLPINTVTSLIGVPVIIWVIVKRKNWNV